MTSAASNGSPRFWLRCALCGQPAESPTSTSCGACGRMLTVDYDAGPMVDPARRGMWRYAPALPVERPDEALTLGEGATPLVRSRAIAARLGLPNLYFKVEGANPTGSYKDRIAAVGLSRTLELGVTSWAATSSGNAGAALAAYGARAGMQGTLFTLESAPRAKLSQILAYGPRAVTIQGLGHDPDVAKNTFRVVGELARARGWALQITAHAFNPIGMEGVRTISFELVEALGRMPDCVYVPTGGGGLLSAIHKGFEEWRTRMMPAGAPAARMVCVQAEGCEPINLAWREGHEMRPILVNSTKISGIQLTAPPDGDLALAAVRSSNGWGTSVSDAETYAAQRMLAREEGLFCEPASATSLAAVLRDAAAGKLGRDDTIVCILTGIGFKDANAVQAMSEGVEIPVIALEDLAKNL